MNYIEQNLQSRLARIEKDFEQKMKDEEKRIREQYTENIKPAQESPADVQTSMAELAKKHRIIK